MFELKQVERKVLRVVCIVFALITATLFIFALLVGLWYLDFMSAAFGCAAAAGAIGFCGLYNML